MEPRNVIVWTLLVVLVVLVMSAGVQAQELREVPASEILEKIRAGEDVYLENVRITGKFNLSKIELETVPIAREKWKIEYLSLEEELKIVESDIIIVNSVFENDVDFSNTQFRKTLAILCTSFLGAGLGGADFIGNADFGGASFGSDTRFLDASFGNVIFYHASFGGDADFRYASFGGDADFTFASFGSLADFRMASFGGDADFSYASFGGGALFNSTKFDKVCFSNTRFNKVSLYETDFKSMKVDLSSIEDALVFDGPVYIKLIKHWDQSRFGAQKIYPKIPVTLVGIRDAQ